jgi:hypothetical protein
MFKRVELRRLPGGRRHPWADEGDAAELTHLRAATHGQASDQLGYIAQRIGKPQYHGPRSVLVILSPELIAALILEAVFDFYRGGRSLIETILGKIPIPVRPDEEPQAPAVRLPGTGDGNLDDARLDLPQSLEMLGIISSDGGIHHDAYGFEPSFLVDVHGSESAAKPLHNLVEGKCRGR